MEFETLLAWDAHNMRLYEVHSVILDECGILVDVMICGTMLIYPVQNFTYFHVNYN